MDNDTNKIKDDIRKLTDDLRNHIHDGNDTQRVDFPNIFAYEESFNVWSATIATTGNTDIYALSPRNMSVSAVSFSGVDALAASDTNYITFTITNLGQDGAGSAAVLASSDANTTKATGGSAIAANTKKDFTITQTVSDLQIKKGDRLRIRAAATGTLANTVTFPVYLISIQ